jgi:hypothetical protein
MRNILDKNCRENQNRHFMFSNSYPEKWAVYEIIWKNMIKPEKPQIIIQYGTSALHDGPLRLQTGTQNI